MIMVICFLCCSCNNNVDELNNNTTESTKEETTKFIESLHFEVNEIVANSKPEELYIQIGDVYFSPTEALKVSEFIERADNSIMELTYKICEDDIRDVFVDYTPQYLVPGGKTTDIFFYCDGQLVFDIEIMNFSDTSTAIKDCFVFTMNEKYELFSKEAVNTKSMCWYFQGVPFGGNEYTFSSIKELFNQWGLEYEENSNSDTLKISAKLNKVEIKFKHQKGVISFYPYYIAETDQSTGKVTSFYYFITGYNKSTYTTTEKASSSTTTSKNQSNKNTPTVKSNDPTDSLFIRGSGENLAETTTKKTTEVTFDGHKPYEVFTDPVSGNKVYYDENGNLWRAESLTAVPQEPTDECPWCGKENCGSYMDSWYCVVCGKNIAAHECHPLSHLKKSL